MEIVWGDISGFCEDAKKFIAYWNAIVQAKNVHICDGSNDEKKKFIDLLLEQKTIVKLRKYDECYLARTNPLDVARLEGRTFICTDNRRESVTIPREGCTQQIGKWANREEMRKKMIELLTGCMSGRTLYIIPFSMGQLGSKLSKTIKITYQPKA